MANEIRMRAVFDTAKAKRNLKGLGDESERASTRVGRLGRTFSGVKGIITGVIAGGIALFVKSLLDAGSRVEELENLVDVSFKDMAEDARAWAEVTSQAFGVAASTFKEQAAGLNLILVGMKVNREAAFEFSTALTQLAQDIASLRNVSPERAFEALRGAITGETEALKSLGIVITEAIVKETDYAKAILATGRELSLEEKAVARVQAILKQTTLDQGDAIRTADSFANQVRRLKEAWKEFTEVAGTELIPVFQKVLIATNALFSPLENLRNLFTLLQAKALDVSADITDQFLTKIPRAVGVLVQKFAELPFGVGEAFQKAADSLKAVEEDFGGAADFMRRKALELRIEVIQGSADQSEAIKEVADTYERAVGAVDNYVSSTDEAAASQDRMIDSAIELAQSFPLEPIEMTRRGYVDMTTAAEEFDGTANDGNERVRESTDIMNEGFSTARSVMSLLGVQSDSTFGKILGFLDQMISAVGSVIGLIGKLAGGIGGLGGLLGGAGNIAGAATGAAGGGGGILSGLFGGLSLGTLGIGAAIGGGILGLTKIFGGKSNFEKVGEELGQTFNDSFSREVQFGIVNLFEGRGGSIGQAVQLSLGEIIKEKIQAGTADFDLLTEKAADTFSFLERGEIDAAEAQKVLNESVVQLIPFLDQLGTRGVEQLRRLAAAAREFNLTLPGAGQIGEFLGGGIPVTGAQSGFEGRVTGPRAFFIEPGVTEDVSITRPGGGGSTVVNIDARGALTNATDLARAIVPALRRAKRDNIDGGAALLSG